MQDASLIDLRAGLVARRDAIDDAIRALDRVFDPAPIRPSEPPRREKRQPRHTSAKADPVDAPESTPSVAARDEALLTALRRNGGIARSSVLRAAMPKESNLTVDQRTAAFRNCCQRLKQKGLIGRTGDTWSLDGISTQDRTDG